MIYLAVSACLLLATVASQPRVHFLGLVPLSGPQGARGRAQQAAIQLALESLANTNTSQALLNISFHDTQCDGAEETRIILQHLSSISEHHQLVALGGSCTQDGDSGALSFYPPRALYPPYKGIRRFVPQVTFEEGVSPTDMEDNVVNTRHSIVSGNEAMVDFIVSRGWRQVALVQARSALYQQSARLLQYRLQENGVSIILVLYNDDGRIYQLLQESLLRVVVIYGHREHVVDVLCGARNAGIAEGRMIWLPQAVGLTTLLRSESPSCSGSLPTPDSIFFSVDNYIDVEKEFTRFKMKMKERYEDVEGDVFVDAAYAYDAAMLSSLSLAKLPGEADDMTVFARQFTLFARDIVLKDAATGPMSFHPARVTTVQIYQLGPGETLLYINNTVAMNQADHVTEEIIYDGTPIYVFVMMTSLASIGIVYSIAILVFNIAKRNDRMIKMTSPNINTLMLLSATMCYGSVILLGIDSRMVPMQTMSALLQTSSYMLALSFSGMYGCLFAKSWRVCLIFKNLSVNGKTTRDEHLLLGVSLLLLVDLAILLPWSLVDPVDCQSVRLSTVYQVSTHTNLIYETDECWSDLQALWIALLYLTKVPLIFYGIIITYKIRHVTLPSLRDSHDVYVTVYTVVIMAIVALPVLTMSRVGVKLKFTAGALLILITVTTTVTMLFIPKIFLVRKETENESSDSQRFLFTESMKKTQESFSRCSLCCCIKDQEEDHYAQEMLATEIGTLKRTIKEKDSTIRELTDRLYLGAEKFQESLMNSSKHRHTQSERQARRAISQPAYFKSHKSCDLPSHGKNGIQNGEVSRWNGVINGVPHVSHSFTENSGTMELSVRNLRTSMSVREHSVPRPNPSNYQHNRRAYSQTSLPRLVEEGLALYPPDDIIIIEDDKPFRTPSPNHDSAIENNSPSSGSERGSERAPVLEPPPVPPRESTPNNYLLTRMRSRVLNNTISVDADRYERDKFRNNSFYTTDFVHNVSQI